MSAVRMIGITATCDRCGAPPRIRVAGELRDVLSIADPEKVMMTYRCHRERPDGTLCNNVYEIRAKHFHAAA